MRLTSGLCNQIHVVSTSKYIFILYMCAHRVVATGVLMNLREWILIEHVNVYAFDTRTSIEWQEKYVKKEILS